MAIDFFDEMAGSPVRDITPVGQRATRMAKIPGSRLDELIAYVFPLADFGRAYPGNAALRASNMHVEPVGSDGSKIVTPTSADLDIDSINTYEWLRVTIDYETMQADTHQGDDPQLLLSHRWAIGGEFLTVDSKGLEWSDGGSVNEDVKAGIVIPTIEHQITWMRVERPPFDVMRDRIGTVNDALVKFKTGEIYPETLVFLGAELNRDILTSGALAWQVGYHFSERRVKALTINDALTTAAACAANDGIWNETTSKCAIPEVGGWNHFYRSESAADPRVEGKSGYYRLRTKAITDDTLTTEPACTAGGGAWDSGLNICVIGGRDPLYQLANFDELFQQAP